MNKDIPMTVRFGYTILYVPDVRATIAFYEAAFGLTPRFLHESNLYAEMETGDTTLAFAGEEMAGDDAKGLGPGGLRGAGDLTLTSEDLRDLESCATCHQVITDEWKRSAHRHASMTNPFYRAAILDLRKRLSTRDAAQFGLPEGITQDQWDQWQALPPEQFEAFVLERQAALAGVERRQLVGLPADHQHAERLEQLERARQIEDGLGAGRDHRDRRLRQRVEIVRDVAAVAAVDAADAAGGEHPDAGAGGQHGGRADRGRGVRRRHARRGGLVL